MLYLPFNQIDFLDGLVDIYSARLHLSQQRVPVIEIIHIFELLGADLFVLLRLTPLILSHVVLLHFLEEFGVLSLGDLFVADTHVGVKGSDPSHGDVGEIVEIDGIFVDFKLIFLEEVEIEKISLFVVVNGLNAGGFVIVLKLHLAIVLDGEIQDISRGAPDFSEVVQLDVVFTNRD